MRLNTTISTILIILFLAAIPIGGYSKINKKKLHTTIAVLSSDSLGGRASGSGYDLKAARYIEKQLTAMGYKPLYGNSGLIEFKFKTRKGEAISYNIVMVAKPKKQLTDKYILMGAHYDHLGIVEKGGEKTLYPGANDNASGIASLLEIARNLNNRKLHHNTIIAAFGGEEIGLVGSRALSVQLSKDSIPLKFMLNLEMTGTLDSSRNVEVLGADTFDMATVIKNTPNPAKLNLHPIKATTHTSDHFSFLQQCPVAVFATTGAKYYHHPLDNLASINLSGLHQLTTYILEFMEHL
ncbi:MAG: M28 family peptidase [Bacteroidales bacterium]